MTTAPSSDACTLDAWGRCITCSDEALPATVVALADDGLSATVEVGGQRTETDITLVEEVRIGDVLRIHAGVALGREGG